MGTRRNTPPSPSLRCGTSPARGEEGRHALETPSPLAGEGGPKGRMGESLERNTRQPLRGSGMTPVASKLLIELGGGAFGFPVGGIGLLRIRGRLNPGGFIAALSRFISRRFFGR